MSIHVRCITQLPALLAAACLIVACNDSPGPITVELPEDAVLTLHSGDQQVAATNTTLPAPLAVRLTTRTGRPIQGARIQWRTELGGGSVQPDGVPSRTDSRGVASASRRLGGNAGTQRTFAAVADLDLEVSFSSFAHVQGAVRMTRVPGDAQNFTDTVRGIRPLRVLLLDLEGRPVPGAAVSWSASSGFAPSPSSSDANGIATVSLAHSTDPGNHEAYGAISGLQGSPVTFYLNVLPGNAVAIEKASGDNQVAGAAQLLAAPFLVHVRDAYGNPITGAPVRWTTVTDTGEIVLETELTHRLDGLFLELVGSDYWHQAGVELGERAVQATATSIAGAASVTFAYTVFAAPPPVISVGSDSWYCYYYAYCAEFSPSLVNIPVDVPVTWHWIVAEDHNVVFEDDPTAPVSSVTKSSGTHVRTFTTAGTYRYRCTLHSTDFTSATAAGTITVVD